MNQPIPHEIKLTHTQTITLQVHYMCTVHVVIVHVYSTYYLMITEEIVRDVGMLALLIIECLLMSLSVIIAVRMRACYPHSYY